MFPQFFITLRDSHGQDGTVRRFMLRQSILLNCPSSRISTTQVTKNTALDSFIYVIYKCTHRQIYTHSNIQMLVLINTHCRIHTHTHETRHRLQIIHQYVHVFGEDGDCKKSMQSRKSKKYNEEILPQQTAGRHAQIWPLFS